jgi:hypothetical protein
MSPHPEAGRPFAAMAPLVKGRRRHRQVVGELGNAEELVPGVHDSIIG